MTDEEIARALLRHLFECKDGGDYMSEPSEPGSPGELLPGFDGNLPLLEIVRFVRSHIT